MPACFCARAHVLLCARARVLYAMLAMCVQGRLKRVCVGVRVCVCVCWRGGGTGAQEVARHDGDGVEEYAVVAARDVAGHRCIVHPNTQVQIHAPFNFVYIYMCLQI